MKEKLARIRIPLPTDTDLCSEVIFANSLGEGRFRVCNIPFYAYNLNLGDIVYASVSADDSLPVYRFTEAGSGNKTMRVYFPVALDNKERLAFMGKMNRLAANVEWANGHLCALSLPTPVVFDTVFDALDKLETGGKLWFETTERVCH